MENKPFSLNSNKNLFIDSESTLNKTYCSECKIKFESQKSLDVHLEYHRERLLSKWAVESEISTPPPTCTPESPAPLTTLSLSSSAEGRVPAVSSKSVGPGPARPMQISMAQSMGIQQGAPPHLSTHHTTNILLSSDVPVESSPSATSLPSINADVSDFFSQLENNPDSAAAVLTINSFTASTDLKLNRFHPYEVRIPPQYQGFGSHPNPTMTHAPTSVIQSYSNYNSNFNEGGVYPNSNDYLAGYAGDIPPHDQSGEDIWDMDANTVRRYNPVPDTVSPGPVPTTPTMYGQPQVQNKPGWESGSSLYPQYGAIRGQTPQTLPPQPISPGIGGPWIGGALPVKGQSVVESKRSKSYQCEACDKWFTSSGHLKRHFNTTLHKNAVKQKGDGYLDGLNGGAFSIPSVESRGAPSPCMSLGEESSQSSVCEEFSSHSGPGHVCLTPASTPGAVSSILSLNHPTSRTGNSSPNSYSSSNLPNVSPQMLSPPPSSVGLPDTASSPLSGLTQMVGVAPPSTPQPPSNSPLTPGSGISLSPNGNLNGSPAHKNRFSPFRAGPPPSSNSYKVQSLDQRSYPSYPTTFQSLSVPGQVSHYTGEVYMTSGSSYRGEGGYGGTGYTAQYSTQYQPVVYNSTYDMGNNYLNHNSAYTDISGYVPGPGDTINIFPDNVRGMKLSERDSPEGSEGSEISLKADPGEFRCNECNKTFNKMCYLKQHNKSFHNGEKPFKCTQCGKRFPVEVLYQVSNFIRLSLWQNKTFTMVSIKKKTREKRTSDLIVGKNVITIYFLSTLFVKTCGLI